WPLIVALFTTCPEAVDVAAGDELPAPTTATASSTTATTDTPPTIRPVCGTGWGSPPAPRGAPARREAPGSAARRASTAHPATSITPATTPAVVRTSRNPNSPNQIDSRYPPRVPRQNRAPAAAMSLLPVSASAPRANAEITWSRNSHLIVGIVL